MTGRFTVEQVANPERIDLPIWRVVDGTEQRAAATWTVERLAREHADWLNARLEDRA